MAKKQNIKRERFVNVAGRRVQKILDSIDSLSKCANKNNYDYEAHDVSKMIKAIQEKVRSLESSYNSNTKSTKNTFQFNGSSKHEKNI
ncbi:MAG: hypothetical protein V4635_09500 [Bacteroidota bacterium]